MRVFGWLVLTGVLVVELAAFVAFGVWGWAHSPRWLLGWLLPLLAATVWGLLAAPRARYGGTRTAAATKVVVFGLAVLALDDAGHPVAASVLLVAVLVVTGLAASPAVAQLRDRAR